MLIIRIVEVYRGKDDRRAVCGGDDTYIEITSTTMETIHGQDRGVLHRDDRT
jgi:hypothetical protein